MTDIYIFARMVLVLYELRPYSYDQRTMYRLLQVSSFHEGYDGLDDPCDVGLGKQRMDRQ